MRPRRGRDLKGRCLTFGEREQIALGRAGGATMRAIAIDLGRDVSTISRELKRNRDARGCYLATTAHALAYIWHQEKPGGTVAVVYVEGDDPEGAIAQFGSSDEPFNAWFRDQMKAVHGVDISQGAPVATMVHDIQL